MYKCFSKLCNNKVGSRRDFVLLPWSLKQECILHTHTSVLNDSSGALNRFRDFTMELPLLPSVAELINIPGPCIVKIEDEYASRNECEELFDISNHLLSPKLEDAPLTPLPGIVEPCKLEADTQELGATCSDNKDVGDTLTTLETETPDSDCSPDHQLPAGILSSNSAFPSDPQERSSNDEEITSSTMATFNGVIQSELLGPKLVVVVKRLTEKAIEELTAGIWRCDSCGKTEKSFLMLDLHFDTGCEKLSPIECDSCPAVVHEYRDFVVHFLEHQMGEKRRCPICLCECIGDMKQHLIGKGHYSTNQSELKLQENPSLEVSQNPFPRACSNSIESYSEAKGLEKRKTYLNSHFYGKKHRKLPRTHAGKNSYKCDICNKCFTSAGNLIQHQRMHTGEKPFKCGICNKYFSASSSLKTHKRVHTGERPFQCDTCKKCFSVSSVLIQHQRVHTGEKQFKCDVCNKCFSQSASLISHQRVHTGEKPYKCDICNKYFSQSSSLNGHQRVHTGEKPFQCDACNKFFSSSGTLIRHQQVHTGEKPFKCDTCTKSFSQSSYLIIHQILHTGEKPFKCGVCNKSFSSSGNLVQHQILHTGKKPFKCNACNKCFYSSGNLTKHQRTHTGEKPFKCDVCYKCFSQSSHLTMHQKRHNG
ncbi:zinc finger protein ZFP2-like [Artemia franciscana]|uniref:zinc finger protein ZFP2-like n=2 Tax=Artemia franciscana TaxID=6661 RepID=UPI0032DBBD52